MSSRPSLRQALRANLTPTCVLWTGAGLLLAAHRFSPFRTRPLNRAYPPP